MTDIKLSEFKAYCLEMFEQKRKIDKMKTAVSHESKKLEDMKSRVVEYLEEHELQNFDTGEGKVSKMIRSSVKITDKPALFEYLKKEGIFEDLATINFQTLNAFYKERAEKAYNESDFSFKLDGVSEPTLFTTIQMRGIK